MKQKFRNLDQVWGMAITAYNNANQSSSPFIHSINPIYYSSWITTTQMWTIIVNKAAIIFYNRTMGAVLLYITHCKWLKNTKRSYHVFYGVTYVVWHTFLLHRISFHSISKQKQFSNYCLYIIAWKHVFHGWHRVKIMMNLYYDEWNYLFINALIPM